MSRSEKILYVGPLFAGSTALHRRDALLSLGCEVSSIDTASPLGFGSNPGSWRWWLQRLYQRSDFYFDWKRLRRQLLQAFRSEDWDVLWLDKALLIKPEVLKLLKKLQPNCRIVHYSPDDMFNPANQTKRYMEAISLYDLHVTTKTYNIEELKGEGARAVFFVGNAYEPSIHRPMTLGQEERERFGCDVCFVGAYESERARSIEKIAAAGVSVCLFGPWEDLASRYSNVRCHTGFFADDDYAKALCAGKIGLGFLRKANRDLQTTRSIELPACGVFMLAERTDEHLDLFEEGREAEFFSTDEELLQKVQLYLKEDSLRKRIAAAGRARCLSGGYSNAMRLKMVLEELVSREMLHCGQA